MQLERIAEGRTAEFFAFGDWALKLLRPGFDRGEVLAEAQKTLTAIKAGAFAPQLLAVLEYQGRPGLLFERLSGQTMLDEIRRNPWRAAKFGAALARAHAAVHARSAPQLVSSHTRLESAIERSGLEAPLRARALALLASLPGGDSLCHGDFHPANLIFEQRGLMVIDWLDASQGNPLADVARTIMLFTIPRLQLPSWQRVLFARLRTVMLGAYRRTYSQLREIEDAQLENWLTVVMAARLAEEVNGEKETLLSQLRRRLA